MRLLCDVRLDDLVSDVATAAIEGSPCPDMAPPKPLAQLGELHEPGARNSCLSSAGSSERRRFSPAQLETVKIHALHVKSYTLVLSTLAIVMAV